MKILKKYVSNLKHSVVCTFSLLLYFITLSTPYIMIWSNKYVYIQ